MTEVEHKKCKGCKCFRSLDLFLNTKGRRLKTCNTCRGRFTCDKCDKKYRENNALQQHIKSIHSKIKDYKCNKCDFKCSQHGHLKSHVKFVHLKIKDYKCHKCDFKCSTNGHLKIHVKFVHDKIKNHECNLCDYKCSDKNSLQKHIKAIHDKIRNFNCDKCDFKCSQNGNLRQHIKVCTGKIKCSAGEFQVMKTLNEMGLSYDYNSSFELKGDTNKFLRWDFVVKTGDEPLFIEYDGMQHFKAIRHFGGEKKFMRQQKYDKLKDDFCLENGYLLLRIPYTDFPNIHQIVSKFIISNTLWSG